MPVDVLIPVAVLFVAGLIKGVFGFADALLAMPILTMLYGPMEAVPLTAICSLATSIQVVITDRVEIAWRAAFWLVVGSVIGVPIGAAALHLLPAEVMASGLGLLLVLYGGIWLWPSSPGARWHLKTERWATPFGLVAGFMGGALTTAGVVVAIYSALRRWDPPVVRATLAGFSLPTGALVVSSHALGGLWTEESLIRVGCALPGAFFAVWLGGHVNRRFPAERFRVALYVLLMAMGGLLLVG